MPRINASLNMRDNKAAFALYYRNAQQVMEAAALAATDTAAKRAKADIRSAMSSSRLGKLGQAIDANSDLSRGGKIKRYPNGGFSASGAVFIRSQSKRTRGAIEAYTQGADIRPVRGRWLWIPTDEIARFAGSNFKGEGYRLTPALWAAKGFDSKVGPLVRIRSINGNPLLIVQNVGVSAAGKARSAKRLNRNGQPAKGQRLKEFVVAFVGIPSTTRPARVDIKQIVGAVQAELPALFQSELRRRQK